MSREDDAYLKTIDRLEPEIAAIDAGGGWASIAISLRRIADAVACANENTLLKQELEIAIEALDEISGGYMRGERELEARASVALMDIKDLGDK